MSTGEQAWRKELGVQPRLALDDLLRLKWDSEPFYLLDEGDATDSEKSRLANLEGYERVEAIRNIRTRMNAVLNDQLSKYLHEAAEHYGHELEDEERQELIDGWWRSNAMKRRRDTFFKLFELAAAFLGSLPDKYQQSLAELAGWKRLPGGVTSSKKVRFQADAPNVQSLRSSPDAAKMLSTGAKLLWWCAAAHRPVAFGFQDVFSMQFLQLPVWTRHLGDGRCVINQEILELVQNVALRLVKSPSEQINSTPEPEVEIEPNGPGNFHRYWWNGKSVELDAKHHELMQMLDAGGKPSVSTGQVRNRLRPNADPRKSHLSGALSKIRFDIGELGITVETTRSKELVVRPMTPEETKTYWKKRKERERREREKLKKKNKPASQPRSKAAKKPSRTPSKKPAS